jgi:hypothetical protein
MGHGAWSIGKYSWQLEAGSRQWAEDRGQRTEDREQRTRDRSQRKEEREHRGYVVLGFSMVHAHLTAKRKDSTASSALTHSLLLTGER